MNFDPTLDKILDECLARGYDVSDISDVLLYEEHEDWKQQAIEEAHRVRVKVASGGYMTKRVIGRKDPKRRMIAKRAARKGRAARMRAARNPRSKMKRQRTLAVRKRMVGPSRPRRPRAGARPRVARRTYRRR